jgi:hypothetical protein
MSTTVVVAGKRLEYPAHRAQIFAKGKREAKSKQEELSYIVKLAPRGNAVPQVVAYAED